ncbi:MAG: YciI family protein [Moraxellaceae bacterium]|nr:YciI family protein [Moraxellaceae bacterium]
MFVIHVNYKKQLSEVDRFIPEHRAFLARHYAAGTFLLSGPQQPRTGGVIIARGCTRAVLEALLQEDPFHREGIADYVITEFLPNRSAPDLAHFIELQA